VAQLVYVAAVLVGSEESVLDMAGSFTPTLLIEKMEYTTDGSIVFSRRRPWTASTTRRLTTLPGKPLCACAPRPPWV